MENLDQTLLISKSRHFKENCMQNMKKIGNNLNFSNPALALRAESVVENGACRL